MSKLACICGELIRDQSDKLPYKGHILKNQDWDAYFEGAAGALLEYLSGVRSGDLETWLKNWPWLRDRTDEHVVWSLLGWFFNKLTVDVYECQVCGRLWVQKRTDSQQFVPFAPEENDSGRVLPSEFRSPTPDCI